MTKPWKLLRHTEGDPYVSSTGSLCIVDAEEREMVEVVAETQGRLARLEVLNAEERDARAVSLLRVVNTHEALIQCCEEAIKIVTDTDLRRRMREVLRQAKGE